MRNIGKWVLLAGLLLASPVFGEDSDKQNDKGGKTDASAALTQQLEQVNKSLKSLTSRFETLERNLDSDLKDLRAKGTTTDLNLAKAQADLLTVKKEIAALRDELNKKTATTQMSGYSGLTTSTGRVRLVNTYFYPQTIVVNGTAYEVLPYQERYTLPLPAGSFTYEVLSVEPRRERLL